MNNPSYHPERMHDYPDTRVEATETGAADTPASMLPSAGEGAAADGAMMPDHSSAATPVIPLPNAGEGGPVYNPPEGTIGLGRPSGGGNGNNTHLHIFPPIFRPVFPGSGGSGSGSSGSVTVIPGVTFPCFNCTATSFGRVRVLNAATGYQPFYVYLGNWLVASRLSNGDLTGYVQSASGSQTITVSGAGGYTYIQKSIQIKASAPMTVAIVNTASGLDLVEISDLSCNAPSSTSCLRTCNLSMNLGPFDVSIGSQNSSYTAFSNVRFREVTPYTSFYPGWYQLYISRSGQMPANAIATAAANLNGDTSYTLFIFNAPTATEGLKTMIVSNS